MDIAQQAAALAGIKQKTIQGKVYSIKLLPASQGLTVGQNIIKGFAPALGVLFDSKLEEDSLFPEEQTVFTDLAIAVVRQMDSLELTSVIQLLMQGLSCDGQAVDFDTHFAGNYAALLSVVEYSLRENFGDFFTLYLKEKGLEIHTLREMMMPKTVESLEASEDA